MGARFKVVSCRGGRGSGNFSERGPHGKGERAPADDVRWTAAPPKRRAKKDGRPAVLLYAGDHDASGEDIDRDFSARTGCWWKVRRVALTATQVRQYALRPSRAKRRTAAPGDSSRDTANSCRSNWTRSRPTCRERCTPTRSRRSGTTTRIDRRWRVRRPSADHSRRDSGRPVAM